MQVLSRVLSSFPTGWLEQELRGRGPGLVYAVGAGHATGLIPGYFSVLFNTDAKQAPEAIARAMAVVERAKTELVDPTTLGRAKAATLVDEFMAKQANGDRATEAALNELYGLGLDESERFRKAVESLTAEQLQAVAKDALKNPVVVVITNEPLPAEAVGQAGVPGATQPVGAE
jgi:zinc protease